MDIDGTVAKILRDIAEHLCDDEARDVRRIAARLEQLEADNAVLKEHATNFAKQLGVLRGEKLQLMRENAELKAQLLGYDSILRRIWVAVGNDAETYETSKAESHIIKCITALKQPALGPNPTVAEIVQDYLKRNGYEGLCQPGDEYDGCGCGLDDYMPCGGEYIDKCQAAYKSRHGNSDYDHIFFLSTAKRDEHDAEWEQNREDDGSIGPEKWGNVTEKFIAETEKESLAHDYFRKMYENEPVIGPEKEDDTE